MNRLGGGLHLGEGDITSRTNQATCTVAVSPVIYTVLPNFHIAGGIGSLRIFFKLGGASKSRIKTFWKLRVATWKVRSMKGKSRELVGTLKKSKAIIACVRLNGYRAQQNKFRIGKTFCTQEKKVKKTEKYKNYQKTRKL